MYSDSTLVLSGGVSSTTGAVSYQTVTGTNTNVGSTNVIDLGSKRDIGEGQDLYLRAQVNTAFVGLTSLEIQIVASDDTAVSTNVTVLASSGAIPLASLTASARFAVELTPKIGSIGQRYLSARYVIVGAGSAGTLFADIGIEIQDGQKFYPSGFSVI